MKRSRKGLFLRPDDLEVGRLCTVHHGWPDLEGQALKISAINLPYVVAKFNGSGKNVPVILDVRTVTLMPVTEEFAQAQATVEVAAAT